MDNHASSRVAFDLIAETMKAAESLIERPQRDRCQDALGAFFFRLALLPGGRPFGLSRHRAPTRPVT
jgi:hypothetical protein